MKFSFRQPVEEDIDFIFNSWLESYRKTETKMSDTVYYDKFKKILTEILQRALVLVACSDEEKFQIYGYIVYENTDPFIVHYIYIKYVYRREGIAGSLLKEVKKTPEPVVCTFANYPFLKLKTKWRLTYNPWLR